MKSENESQATRVAMGVLVALGGAHLLNDLLQAVLTASYPILKDDLRLSFSEIGLVTLIYQLAASVFQPVVGASGGLCRAGSGAFPFLKMPAVLYTAVAEDFI